MNSEATSIVNIQLVESLIQAIQALSPAEQNLVRSRLFPVTTQHSKQSIIDILNEAPGQQLFQTPEEVDQYLQQERASWDT
jgi:hypothetical protein